MNMISTFIIVISSLKVKVYSVGNQFCLSVASWLINYLRLPFGFWREQNMERRNGRKMNEGYFLLEAYDNFNASYLIT